MVVTTAVFVVAGVALLALAVYVESRADQPIIPLGVSAPGAVLAGRVTSLLAEKLGPAATGGGTAKVPDLAKLPPDVLQVVREVYGQATADLFLVGAPIALLAVIAVVFIKEKPLHTLSGDERRAQEEAATGET